MDSSDIWQIIVLIILLMMSAFFSASETALISSNKMKLRSRAEEGDKKAAKVLQLFEDQDRVIGAILIGNNIVNLFASSLATTIALSLWGSKSVAIATGILTLLVLVFGEVTPKTAATRYADDLACSVSGIIDILAYALAPVIKLVNGCAGLAMRLFGMDPDKEKDIITEEELMTMVEASHEDGVIESDEKEMITNVVDFGDTLAKDIMIPRVDMKCIDAEADYDELMRIFREDKFTRIPVYKESPDNIIGIINMKDLLLKEEDTPFSIKDMMREPFYTYEFKKVKDLMPEMRRKFENLAIILDEYGVTAGMITMEDLIEEIVGEIRDEYDYDETENIIKVRDNEYIIEGSTKPEELNEKFDLGLDEEDHESIAGIMMEMLDHVPTTGEEVSTDRFRLVVEKMDRMRIDSLKLYII